MFVKPVLTLCVILIIQSYPKSGVNCVFDKMAKAAEGMKDGALGAFQKAGQTMIEQGAGAYCEHGSKAAEAASEQMAQFLKTVCDAQCKKDHVYWKVLEHGPSIHQLICGMAKDTSSSMYGTMVGCFMKSDKSCMQKWGEEIENLQEVKNIIESQAKGK